MGRCWPTTLQCLFILHSDYWAHCHKQRWGLFELPSQEKRLNNRLINISTEIYWFQQYKNSHTLHWNKAKNWIFLISIIKMHPSDLPAFVFVRQRVVNHKYSRIKMQTYRMESPQWGQGLRLCWRDELQTLLSPTGWKYSCPDTLRTMYMTQT